MELKKFASSDSVFHRNDGIGGKRNMDAYQVIWGARKRVRWSIRRTATTL
jgi:hypothetical protein